MDNYLSITMVNMIAIQYYNSYNDTHLGITMVTVITTSVLQ
jgi:hypothetical protein